MVIPKAGRPADKQLFEVGNPAENGDQLGLPPCFGLGENGSQLRPRRCHFDGEFFRDFFQAVAVREVLSEFYLRMRQLEQRAQPRRTWNGSLGNLFKTEPD